jgi:putative hemolysin
MTTNPWLDLSIVVALIAASGVLALGEAATLAARRPRLQGRARAGSKRAATALALARDPERLRSAVQAATVFLATLSGVLGGHALGPDLSRALVAAWPTTAPYAGVAGLVLVVVGVSYLSLVLGRMVPRRLALARPELFALWSAPIMKVLRAMAGPASRVLGGSADAILWLLRARRPAEAGLTGDDLRLQILEGLDSVDLDPAEQEILLRVFRLSDRRAASLMTPRDHIVWIDVNDSTDEMRRKLSAGPYSNFPVCDGSLDNLIGVVRAKDFLLHGLAERSFAFKGLLAVPLFVYEGTRGPQLLDLLRKSGQYFAVVLDEFGSVIGVLTMTDLLQALVGSLPMPDTVPRPRSVRKDDGSWLLDGTLSPDEVGPLIGHAPLPIGDYHTLAGFLIAQLGRIPAVSESVDWEDLRFEVIEMDANRIDRILVSPRPLDA